MARGERDSDTWRLNCGNWLMNWQIAESSRRYEYIDYRRSEKSLLPLMWRSRGVVQAFLTPPPEVRLPGAEGGPRWRWAEGTRAADAATSWWARWRLQRLKKQVSRDYNILVTCSWLKAFHFNIFDWKDIKYSNIMTVMKLKQDQA